MKSLRSMIRGCITSPRETLESVQEGDLRRSVVFVLFTAVLAAVAGYNYGLKLATAPGGIPVAPTAFALGGLMGVLIWWLLPAAAIHVFTSLQTGENGFRRFVALTGFASVPHIFRHVLRIVDALTISTAQMMEVISSRSNPAGLLEKVVNGSTGTLNVFGLWSLALIVIAAKVNYKASTRKAAITTIVVYLALMLFRALLPIG
jgi:hypothetical protein